CDGGAGADCDGAAGGERTASGPRPRPLTSRRRADGVRVLGDGPALLPGLSLGPALRLDVSIVPGGVVYISRALVIRELGDDDKGAVHVGLVRAQDLGNFWSTVTGQSPAQQPVIIHVPDDAAAELVRLLRALPDSPEQVLSYRLDDSSVGTQRSSYLLPVVDTASIQERGLPRLSLEEAPEAVRPLGAQYAGDRRRDARGVQRLVRNVHHNVTGSQRTDVHDVYVDGSTLRGARVGGSAATAAPGLWAARVVPGAVRSVESELDALLLGHLMALWVGDAEHGVTVHSDSRAALALLRDAIAEPVTLGGARGDRVRRIMRNLLELREQVSAAGVPVRARWIKGHAGDQGNEVADALSRSVARNTLAHSGDDEIHRRLTVLATAWQHPPDSDSGAGLV
ncbi:MAG: ribonuclease HI, partial [Micrococcus sp.]|nr:ribonuclease HI [Micrococcus sp.]